MQDLLIFVVTLGLAVVFIGPFLSKMLVSKLPNKYIYPSVPSGYPTTIAQIAVSILVWGLVFGAILWALSRFIRPVGRAVSAEA